ncbi:fumarate hydratase [Escherichia coli]|nr:fumarate hydratase [Escherichia coli]
MPTSGNEQGQAFRDIELEKVLLEVSQQFGIGAQFGGKYFAHDIRVIRLPRHGGSCPIAMALSCSADRNIKAKLTSTVSGWKNSNTIRGNIFQPHCGKKITRNMYNWI